MPQAATITLADGQGVPVNHDFNPQGAVGPALCEFYNGESTTSAGAMKLALGFSRPTSNRPTTRIKLSFAQPKEALGADGVTRVVDTARCNIEWIVPETFTQAEKDNFEAFCRNAVAHAVVQGYVADSDPCY